MTEKQRSGNLRISGSVLFCLFLSLWAGISSCAAGEKFEPWVPALQQKLTKASAGRMLFHRKGKWCRLYVFRDVLPDGCWLCCDLQSGREHSLVPASLHLLPFCRDNDELTIDMLVIWYMTGAERSDTRALYTEIGRVFPSARIRKLQDFFAEFQQQKKMLSEKMGALAMQMMAGGAESELQDIGDSIKDGAPLKMIKDISLERDYYLASLLFVYYQRWFNLFFSRYMLQNNSGCRDAKQKLDELAGEIVGNYRIDRSRGKALEENFTKLCPQNLGFLRSSSTGSMQELAQNAGSALGALLKSRSLSPECDFPQWGSCMLEVFAMSPEIKELEGARKEFQQALDAYRDFAASGEKP